MGEIFLIIYKLCNFFSEYDLIFFLSYVIMVTVSYCVAVQVFGEDKLFLGRFAANFAATAVKSR